MNKMRTPKSEADIVLFELVPPNPHSTLPITDEDGTKTSNTPEEASNFVGQAPITDVDAFTSMGSGSHSADIKA